jgi:hypothetical protein
MQLEPAQLDALKAFLVADSHGLGIAAKLSVGDDGGVADLMNTINVSGWAQVNNEPVQPSEIEQQITAADLSAMTLTQKQSLTTLAALTDAYDLNNTNTMAKLVSCFPADGQTVTNLQSLSKRAGRPMEVLFGVGSTATANNISDAMSRP